MGLFSSKKEKLYQRGREAMRLGRDQEAADCLTQAAELGHPGAGMILGDFYRKGKNGWPKDYAKAARYYSLNPEPWGRASLGILYFYGGNGLEQDPDRALALFRESLEAKKYRFYQSEGFLGAMHFWGRGLKQSYEKAAQYLEKYMKTHQGDYPDVDYCYEYLRLHGLGGVKQDSRQAMKNMEGICLRAETPEVRRLAASALADELLELDADDLTREQVHTLETAARAGMLPAACKAAIYYLTHVRVITTKEWDEDREDWVETKEEKIDLWEDAALALQLILGCEKPQTEEERTYLNSMLFWNQHTIQQRNPDLWKKLVDFAARE